MVPIPITVQDIMEDANNGKDYGLPPASRRQKVLIKNGLQQNILHDHGERKEDVSTQCGKEKTKHKITQQEDRQRGIALYHGLPTSVLHNLQNDHKLLCHKSMQCRSIERYNMPRDSAHSISTCSDGVHSDSTHSDSIYSDSTHREGKKCTTSLARRLRSDTYVMTNKTLEH